MTGVDLKQQLREIREEVENNWTVRRTLKEANLTPKSIATGRSWLQSIDKGEEFACVDM